MYNIVLNFFSALLLGHISGLCGSVLPVRNSTIGSRAADTCADPSLTVVYVDVYSQAFTLHFLGRRAAFIDQDTVDNSDWEIQEEVFRAWKDPQDFTVPLYELENTSSPDVFYAISTTGLPPVVSGFPIVTILGYVYSTQVCGSVPLLAVAQKRIGDRYFTTDQDTHDQLVSFGWLDQGVVAYVLPVDLD